MRLTRKHAVLPENLEESTISSMCTGESGWTVPWAMWVDRDRRCWLHPGYTIHTAPLGAVQMRVELREDGYHVWLTGDQRYSPSDEPGFASSVDTQYLPVVELHQP